MKSVATKRRLMAMECDKDRHHYQPSMEGEGRRGERERLKKERREGGEEEEQENRSK